MWSAVRFPLLVDLSRPEDVLNYTRNFYLNTEEGISVGVWHTLPASQWEEATGKGPEWYQETLGDDRPVIIYLHGNVGTRWDGEHAAGYHVLSLDYRGFGDSTGEPSEAGLTSDALYLYHWVKQRSKDSLVCLWGHSLGTGVATNTAVKILEQGEFKRLCLKEPSLLEYLLEENNIEFANDKNLKILTSPLLILHAEDDHVVPYHMGQQLYQISLEAQSKFSTDVKVKMVSYEASRGYSHSSMYLDPNLSDVVG
uniref:AB hydrolase-1 domain-containing protein n=1 Tax=Salarias fasciatus TaxID=181472 RepID=A0A672I1C8_SALFA